MTRRRGRRGNQLGWIIWEKNKEKEANKKSFCLTSLFPWAKPWPLGGWGRGGQKTLKKFLRHDFQRLEIFFHIFSFSKLSPVSPHPPNFMLSFSPQKPSKIKQKMKIKMKTQWDKNTQTKTAKQSKMQPFETNEQPPKHGVYLRWPITPGHGATLECCWHTSDTLLEKTRSPLCK